MKILSDEQFVADCDSEDFGAVLNCAVRYCIGRQTYMPKLVMDFIRPLLPSLSDITITVMIKDIEKADNLGDKDIDEPEWNKFLVECKKELGRRKK